MLKEPGPRVHKKILDLVKDAFFYGVINSIAKTINIILLPIFTRVFSPGEYGAIDIISVSISLISVLVVLNLTSAMSRYFYDACDEQERSSLVSTLFYLISLSSVIFIAFCWSKAEYISTLLFNTTDYTGIIKIAVLVVPFSVLLDYLLLLLRMEKNIKCYGIVNIGDILLTITLSIYLVVFLKIGIVGVFLAILISKAALFCVSLLFTYRYFSLNISRKLLMKSLCYAIPAAPAVFATWANSSLNRYFILAYEGNYGVGIFSVGFKIGMAMSIIVQSFRMGWGPFAMSIINDEDNKEVYRKVLTYYCLVLFSIGALITVCSRELLLVLAGIKYLEAYKIIGLVVGGIIIQGAFHIIFIGAMIAEKSYVVTISSLAGIMVNVVLMQLLIPEFGIMGAAIAFFATFVVSSTICYLYSQKFFYINFELRKICWIFSLYVGVIMCSLYTNAIEQTAISYFLKTLTMFFFLFGVYVTAIDKNEIAFTRELIASKLGRLSWD